jgi:hypothetical protein
MRGQDRPSQWPCGRPRSAGEAKRVEAVAASSRSIAFQRAKNYARATWRNPILRKGGAANGPRIHLQVRRRRTYYAILIASYCASAHASNCEL